MSEIEKLQSALNWAHFSNTWYRIGDIMRIKRELDYYEAEYNKVRKQFVRKGRPVGWRKDGSHKQAA